MLRVAAENAIGLGPYAQQYFRAYGVPSAPQNIEVKPGDEFIEVFWDAPEFENGSDVTEYRLVVNPGAIEKTIDMRYGRNGAQIDGLQNGVEYSASVYAINEAGAGPAIVSADVAPMDDAVDADNDGVPDVLEARVGSSTQLADTDNDGLSDAQEILQLAASTSPTLDDTNGDGIFDADEDSDLDGVTNAAELLVGLNPSNPDSDADGITDGQEVISSTDPLMADTDGDGLTDGFEVRAGLNPAAADSDADGLGDASDEISISVQLHGTPYSKEEWDTPEPPPTGSELRATTATTVGPAGVLATVFVAETPSTGLVGALTTAAIVDGRPDEPATTPAALTVGPQRFLSTPPPSVTGLHFGYSAVIAAERLAELAPAYWDEVLGTWSFAENDVTVSTATRTITIHSPQLGLRYAVVDLGEWAANASQCDAARSGLAPLDVEIILDRTSSVQNLDPSGERYDALRSVVSSLRPSDQVVMRDVYVMGFYARGDANGYMVESNSLVGIEPKGPYLGGSTTRERTLAWIDDAQLSDQPYSDDESDLFNDDGYSIEKALADSSFANRQFFGSDEVMNGCRDRAIVFVTDGHFKPASAYNSSDYEDQFGDGYVPFVQGDIPVHVLDIGLRSPASSDWLIGLAQDSGGTYSYVPTATDMAGWISAVKPPEPVTEDTTTDTDGDGVTDWVETHGVISTMTKPGADMPRRYFGNPTKADTDGDGLTDAEEFGAISIPAGRVSTVPAVSYAVISDPRRADGDDDGLRDFEEVEVGMNALDADPDGDGLLDADEELHGTFAQMPDTDLDGFSDRFEVEHREQGYDPREPDPVVSKYQWLEDLALGFFCGEVEFCSRDTIAWLTGNVASGLLIFGDLRDGVAAAFRGDWVMTAVYVVGFIPFHGDLVATTSKVVRFVVRLASPIFGAATRSSPAAAAFISPYRKQHNALRFLKDAGLPPGMYVAALRGIDNDFVDALKARSITDETIRSLVYDNGIHRIKRMLDSPTSKPYTYTSSLMPSPMPTGMAGERFLHDLVGIPGFKQEPILVTLPNGTVRTRWPDGIVRLGTQSTFYESKVGYAASAFTTFQTTKDAQIRALDLATSYEWHFLPSAATGRIGASDKVLDALEAAGISIVTHLPR